MRVAALAFALAVAVPVAHAAVAPKAPAPVKAVGSVELADAAGDMGPITTSDGTEPPLDVVKLVLKSDGTRLTAAATLAGPPGRFADSAVELFVDTDNDAGTGAKLMRGDVPGFEFMVQVRMCIDYADKSASCAGGSSRSKPVKWWGAVDVKRYKGKDEFDREDVVDSLGFPGTKASVKTPMAGQVVEASVDYSDLKVKPGQTIRILAREAGGNPKDGNGDFPVVLLTLK